MLLRVPATFLVQDIGGNPQAEKGKIISQSVSPIISPSSDVRVLKL